MRHLHVTDGETEAERAVKETAQVLRAGERTWARATYSASMLKFSLMGSRISLPFTRQVLEGKSLEVRVMGCKQQKPGADPVSKRKGL